jgi:hypothetical protein
MFADIIAIGRLIYCSPVAQSTASSAIVAERIVGKGTGVGCKMTTTSATSTISAAPAATVAVIKG